MNEKSMLNEQKLLKLLKGGSTLVEMKQELGYHDQQLAMKLQSLINRGYLIKRNYHNDKVIFTLVSDLKQFSQKDTLSFRFHGEELNCIFISDTHIGSNREQLKCIKNVYEYANEKAIPHIFHLGDLVEGYNFNFKSVNQYPFSSTEEMVQHLIKHYPKIDDVTTTVLLGNHDKYSIQYDSFDIRNMISQKRADIHFVGYKHALISVLDKNIVLQHPSGKKTNEDYHRECFNQYQNQKIDFIFRGHCHESKVFDFDGIHTIHVPAMIKGKKQVGAWQCTFFASDNKRIERVVLQPLIIEPVVFPITEFVIDCKEDFEEELENTKERYSGLSQIERFNKRYQKKK